MDVLNGTQRASANETLKSDDFLSATFAVQSAGQCALQQGVSPVRFWKDDIELMLPLNTSLDRGINMMAFNPGDHPIATSACMGPVTGVRSSHFVGVSSLNTYGCRYL